MDGRQAMTAPSSSRLASLGFNALRLHGGDNEVGKGGMLQRDARTGQVSRSRWQKRSRAPSGRAGPRQ